MEILISFVALLGIQDSYYITPKAKAPQIALINIDGW